MKIVREDIHGALATAVTVIVDAVGVGRVTLVPSNVEGVLVSLHDIELGAPVATDPIGITVPEVVASVIDSWHDDSVESRNAPATHLRKIDVEVHDATKQVDREELVTIQCVALGQVQSVVVVESEVSSAGCG